MKLLDVLNGQAVWPPPVWLMRQAGRYLPEYRELRAEAGDFLKLCMNPKLAAEVTLREDVSALRVDAAVAGFAPIIETVRLTRAELSDQTALIGFAGGPFTVACYMLDGKGSGGDFPRTRMLAYENLALVEQVIELLVQATILYLQAQLAAGANCVMLFESWAGILPARLFKKLVIEPNRQIVAALRASNPAVKIIGFPRLSGLLVGAYVRGTGVDAVGLDSVTDPACAIAACPPGTVFQGNLDPLLMRVGGLALENGIHDVLNGFRGHRHIFNLGHGITPDVKPETVAQLMNVIQTSSATL